MAKKRKKRELSEEEIAWERARPERMREFRQVLARAFTPEQRKRLGLPEPRD